MVTAKYVQSVSVRCSIQSLQIELEYNQRILNFFFHSTDGHRIYSSQHEVNGMDLRLNVLFYLSWKFASFVKRWPKFVSTEIKLKKWKKWKWFYQFLEYFVNVTINLMVIHSWNYRKIRANGYLKIYCANQRKKAKPIT